MKKILIWDKFENMLLNWSSSSQDLLDLIDNSLVFRSLNSGLSGFNPSIGLQGVPGSGKTTLAAEMSFSLPAIDMDNLHYLVGESLKDGKTNSNLDVLHYSRVCLAVSTARVLAKYEGDLTLILTPLSRADYSKILYTRDHDLSIKRSHKGNPILNDSDICNQLVAKIDNLSDYTYGVPLLFDYKQTSLYSEAILHRFLTQSFLYDMVTDKCNNFLLLHDERVSKKTISEKLAHARKTGDKKHSSKEGGLNHWLSEELYEIFLSNDLSTNSIEQHHFEVLDFIGVISKAFREGVCGDLIPSIKYAVRLFKKSIVPQLIFDTYSCNKDEWRKKVLRKYPNAISDGNSDLAAIITFIFFYYKSIGLNPIPFQVDMHYSREAVELYLEQI